MAVATLPAAQGAYTRLVRVSQLGLNPEISQDTETHEFEIALVSAASALFWLVLDT